MANQIKAPINYPIIAGGKIVSGGSVIFGQPNVKPDPDNPSTLKAVYLDAALKQQAENPQGISSDGVFDQSDTGILYGPENTVYSIVILGANKKQLSYIPEYDLSDANAAATAQSAAAQAESAASNAIAAKDLTEALYTDFTNRYFGSYSSDPSVDDLGNPPNEGSIYFNTVSDVFFTWNGSAWVNYFPSNPNGLMVTATGTTTPRSLADRWADVVNAMDFSSLASGGDWTVAMQAAIDYATTLNKPLYIPSGIYTISQSGVFNGRGYGLLLKSNLHIIGAGKDTTILRSSQDADIDLFNTDRTASHSNVSLSNLTLDGNEQNRTGTTLAGFNLWTFGITDLSLSNIKSINTGSWGLRIQSCENVELLNIKCDHSAESNSDGIHFVDTSHVVGSNISIYTEGDDAFIIEANTKDVVDYNISSLSVSAPNGLALPARGILLLVDHDVATAAWNINDIVIDATVKDCTGHGVILVGGKYEGVNIKAVVSGACSFAALYLQPGFSGNVGHILNSSFKVTARDLAGSGVICADDFGAIKDNNINISVYNPAEGKVSVNLKGDRWSGDIKSNYNPNSDKTAFAQGVVLHGSNNTLTIDSIGSQVNLLLQATSQDNNITLGELGDSTVYDLQIVSGSEGHSFYGGRVRGNIFIPFNNTSKFSAVDRLTNRFKTTIDMSVNADGTASIPHELAATPVTSLITMNTGSMLTPVVTSQDATNIGVLIHNNAGSPVTTGVFNIFIDTSI